jgi:hypothetical protein
MGAGYLEFILVECDDQGYNAGAGCLGIYWSAQITCQMLRDGLSLPYDVPVVGMLGDCCYERISELSITAVEQL